MTGKLKDWVGELAAVFEISEYDDYAIQVSMVPTEEAEDESIDSGGEPWVLFETDEPGTYTFVRTDR